MSIQKLDLVDIELNTGNIHRSFLNHAIGMKDNEGDAFGIRVFRDGEPVSLSEVVVQGYFRNPVGTNIAITTGNSVSGNTAYVVLPQACYDYEGQFTLAIKLIGGGITGTMRIVDGVVSNTNTTSPVAPVGAVPTYQEVLAVFEQAEQAVAKAGVLKSINLFKSALANHGWTYMWNVTDQSVETVTGDAFGQSDPIKVNPGEKIIIWNVTPGTDIYSIIRLGSNDLTDTLSGMIATPSVVGEDSRFEYEVPDNTYWITVGYVASLEDKICIESLLYDKVEKMREEMRVEKGNLFDINGYFPGWFYQPAQGGGVEKTVLEGLGQTNVFKVKPGDVVHVYGATSNTDFFFITAHDSSDIDDVLASVQIIPIKAINGYSYGRFSVPDYVQYLSVAFVLSGVSQMRIFIGSKAENESLMEVNALGDSLTYGFIVDGVRADPTWCKLVESKLGCKVNNYGVNATSICDGSSESFLARLTRMTETFLDCLVIFGGTNDYGDERALTLGSISDSPAQGTNFYASFKNLVESAITKYPDAQILVVTPLRRYGGGANSKGISMEDIATAEKTVAEYYGVECLDLFHEGGFNPNISAQKDKYTSDGLHLIQLGVNRFLGPRLAEAIERVIKFRG